METIAGLGQHWNDEARLRRSWHDEARFQPFYPYPYICDDGLLLGASTKLAQMAKDRWGNPFLQIDGEEERILALLSLAYRKHITTEAIRYFKRASAQWTKGDRVLAHFELAFARLPRFAAREDAFQLFCADGLVKQGVAPRWLMRYQGLDAGELDLLKYSPDQPRVPAGSGRESGWWTSGDGGAQVAEAPKAPSSGHHEVMSDVSPDPIRPGQQYAQDRPKWWMPYQLPVDTGRGGGDVTGRGAGTDIGQQSEAAPKAGEADSVARTIEISPERFGQAAEHMRDAINAGQPDVLTIDRAGADANRAAATKGLEKVPGMHLDEYPPAMFKEGGVQASVRAINPGDNTRAGAYIGNRCRPFPNGARIRIKVGEPK